MSPRGDEFLDIHAAAGQLGKCSPIRSCHDGDMFKGPCPYCGGSSDKVTVTSTHDGKILLFCHQCERSGQELAEAMGVSLRRKGSGNSGHGDGTPVPPVKVGLSYKPPTDTQVEAWWTALQANPERLECLHEERGITDTVILVARIGWDGKRYTLPVCNLSGTIHGMVRYLPGADRKMLADKGSTRLPMGLEELPHLDDGTTLLITEGEMDALTCRSYRYYAIGAPGAPGWPSTWTKDYGLGRFDCVVAGDNDEAGRDWSAKVAAHVPGCRVLQWPEGVEDGHDATDELTTNGTHAFGALVDSARTPEASDLPADEQPVEDEEHIYVWNRASVRELITAPAVATPWVVPQIVARDELAVLTAPPKTGKSYVLTALAIDAALGRSVWGVLDPWNPIKVLWIDEEMGRWKIQRRLQRLAAGLELTDDELDALDANLDIRPQQGFQPSFPDHLLTLRSVMDETGPDLVVVDSIIAVTPGKENSADDKRRFYNEVLAPLKSDYQCALLCAAHPPLPSKEAGKDSQKRARGSGDITAQADRTYWLGGKNEERSQGGMIVTIQFGSYVEREASDSEGFLLTIDGAPEPRLKPGETPEAPLRLTVTGLAVGSDKAATQIGEEHQCQMAILRELNAGGGALYQPDLKSALISGQGISERTYDRARSALVIQKRISLTRRGETPSGKPKRGSGKWVELVADDE